MSASERSYRAKVSALEVLGQVALQAGAPSSATLEVADRCNEVCVHCYQVQGLKGELSTAQLCRAIDELAELGVLVLTFSGGEATLRDDLLELIEHARRRRFVVKLYTNGLRMNEELARRLGELAVQEVQISLYSPRAEVHDWVTRVPGSFDRVLSATRALRQARVPVLLKTPLLSINRHDLDGYIALATELGASYQIDPHLVPREDGDGTPQALEVTQADYLAVATDPRFSSSREDRRGSGLDDGPCGACSGSVHIEANGQLQPCSVWALPTGDVVKEGVAAAWRDNPKAQIVRRLSWRDLPACRQCALQPYCARCYAEAQVVTGNALAPYRQACDRATLEYRIREGVSPVIEGPVGPYARRAPHTFSATTFVLSDQDQSLLARAPWLSSAAGAAGGPEPGAARPGQLVQLRRPGRPPLTERVPGPSDPGHPASGSSRPGVLG